MFIILFSQQSLISDAQVVIVSLNSFAASSSPDDLCKTVVARFGNSDSGISVRIISVILRVDPSLYNSNGVSGPPSLDEEVPSSESLIVFSGYYANRFTRPSGIVFMKIYLGPYCFFFSVV